MGFSQRKSRKAKVLSERIGVEESLVCYENLQQIYRSSVLQGRVPACSPRHAGVTGEELEIRVWQNLAQLVGGWEGGTELE